MHKPNWLSVQHSVKRFTLSHLCANLKLPRKYHGNSAKMPWYFLKNCNQSNQKASWKRSTNSGIYNHNQYVCHVRTNSFSYGHAQIDPMKDYLFWTIQFSCQQAMYLRRDTVFVGWLWHNSMYKFQCWSVSNVLDVKFPIPIQFQCFFFGGLRRMSRIIFIVHW